MHIGFGQGEAKRPIETRKERGQARVANGKTNSSDCFRDNDLCRSISDNNVKEMEEKRFETQ